MTLVTFAQVFTVCLLGAMSPGPSMAVVINNAIFKGRYNGILTSIGHGIGIAFYATFAVLGLGLIINTNIFIFNGLKILSIIFLIFIGTKSILNKEKLNYLKDQNMSVIWQCGPYYYPEYKDLASERICVVPFIDNMAMAYAAADLIISRSGALSVSELALVGKPVVFIPSPNVAEDHQTKNAKALVDQNAAIMLKEDVLDDRFEEVFTRLIQEEALRQALGRAIKLTAMPNATRDIVDQLSLLSS